VTRASGKIVPHRFAVCTLPAHELVAADNPARARRPPCRAGSGTIVADVGDSAVRLGIDFGTSNTVAVLQLPNREPRPLLFDGSPLLPSAVCVDAGGRLVVGRDAIHTASGEPGSFEPHPKRCIDDETVLLGGREIAVGDLIGAVLHRVASEATRAAGRAPTDAVLTCPAGWGSARRDTLRRAAGAALPHLRLVVEPVAAVNHFLAVGDDLPAGRVAVVYDFGAGTFDASVIRRTSDGFDVLATEGLNDCGGLDLDAAIIDAIGVALRERVEWGRLVEPRSADDRRASRQLWDNVRAAKEMLSRAAMTIVHVPLVNVEVPVGREQLDAAAAPILARTVEAVRLALRTAQVAPDDVAAVYLAGGSARMPAVTTALHRAFGLAPTMADQPELAVAEGSIQNPPAGPVAAAPPDPSWPTVSLVKTAPGRPAPGYRFATHPRRRIVAAVAAIVAVLAAATLAWSLRPEGHADARSGGPDTSAGSASGPMVPSPSSSAAPSVSYADGVDPCLVGTWTRTAGTMVIVIDGAPRTFTGAGGHAVTYRRDGMVEVSYSNSSFEATVNGARWRSNSNGGGTARYRAVNGTMIYSEWTLTGKWVLYRNGRVDNTGDETASIEPERYTCTADTLHTATGSGSATFTRVG
jgi:molecular chaperone DnaK